MSALAQIRLSEFLDVIFPAFSDASDRMLAVMVTLQLDESFDGKVYAVAGFWANQFAWLRVEHKWEQCLAKYNLNYFKASECETLTGQFAQFRKNPTDVTAPLDSDEKAKRTEIKTEFVDIAVDSEIVGFGATVLLKDFNEVCAQDARAASLLEHHPYFVCAHASMGAAGYVTTRVNHDKGTNHMLALVLDENREIQGRFLSSYNDFREKNPYAAEYMVSVTFTSEFKFKPLQAADLLVYEARKLLFNSVYDPGRMTRIAMKRMAPNVQSLYRFDRRALQLMIEETVTGKPVSQIIEERFGPDQKIEMFFELSMD